MRDYCNRERDTSSVTLGTTSNRNMIGRYMDKFLKEARTIATLNHPNIIHIYDIFRENNTAYYVMDYIEGESLSQIVKHQGAFPEKEAVRYIYAVAGALKYIHQRNINHLDVKPGNIMLSSLDHHIYLLDFGLAKQYDVDGYQTSSTPVGISHGYAPIEQYTPGGVQYFSPQSDIYSLGATFYYLLTGIVPPPASELLNVDLEFPVGISFSIRNAIKQSMRPQKDERPKDIDAFLQFLEEGIEYKEETQFITTMSGDVVEKSILEDKKKEIVNSKIKYKYIVIIVLFFFVGGVFFFENQRKSSFNGSNVIPEDTLMVMNSNDSIINVDSTTVTSPILSNNVSLKNKESIQDNVRTDNANSTVKDEVLNSENNNVVETSLPKPNEINSGDGEEDKKRISDSDENNNPMAFSDVKQEPIKNENNIVIEHEEKSPTIIVVHENDLGKLRNNGIDALEKRDYRNAYINFSSYMNLTNNQDAVIAFNCGICADKINNWEDAIKYFNIAIQKKFHIADAYIGKAGALRNLKRNEEYIATLKEAINVVPYDERLLNMYATYYVNQGILAQRGKKVDAAEAAFKQALTIQPENQNALTCLSSLYYMQGAALVQTDLEKAKAEFAEAKTYLEKLIPLLSDANATHKKIKANATTMLNYINSLK